jgi:hypothetical protein
MVVIFIITTMISLIMWIYANSQWTKATQETDRLKQTYAQAASTGALAQGGAVEELNAAKPNIQTELQNGNTAVDVAVAEIKKLTRDISKESTTYYDADLAAAGAVKRSEKVFQKAGGATTRPTAAAPQGSVSLVAELDKLSKALSDQIDTTQHANDALANVQKELADKVAGWDAQYAELKKSFDAEHNRAEAASKAAEEARGEYEKKAAEVGASANAVAGQTGKKYTDLLQEFNQAQAAVVAAKKAAEDALGKLKHYDVKNPAVRQADATIVRVPSANICYINLGSNDHIPVGITFEVYDKNEGVPGLGSEPTSDTDLPTGKASIEVIKVGQNSSECRIVHVTPGATLSEGDIVANLIYDRNVKPKFVIYGKFDVDGNGVWTAPEANVIKSLVTRWGGELQDHVTSDTDFVVVGKEPEVPALTKEERDDPIRAKQFEEASKELKDYNDLLSKATDLHIPVMNQNRFMYYIGYFDQLKR